MENIFKIFGYFVFLNSKSCKKKKWIKKKQSWGGLPCGPVAKTPCSQDRGFNPWSGN